MVRIGSVLLLALVGACAAAGARVGTPIYVSGPIVPDAPRQTPSSARALSPVPAVSPIQQRLDAIDKSLRELRDELDQPRR